MSLREIKTILRREKGRMAREFGVRRLGIFGSFVRGEATLKSDVDILVRFSRTPGYFGLVALEAHLSDRLGRKVDLVTPEALRPAISRRIMKEVVYL